MQNEKYDTVKIGLLAGTSLSDFRIRTIEPIFTSKQFIIKLAIIDKRPKLSIKKKLIKNIKRGRGGYIFIMAIKRIFTKKETNIFVENVNKIIKKLLFKNFLKNSKFAVISSVVPSINTHIIKILKTYKIKVFVLKPKDVLSYLKIDYNLNEIKDLLSNKGETEINFVIKDKNKQALFSLQENRKFDLNHLKALKAKKYVGKITV